MKSKATINKLVENKQCQYQGFSFTKACRVKIAKIPACKQTTKLLKLMDWATYQTQSPVKHNNLVIIESQFMGDGVPSFTIINPQGSLINVAVNPKILSNKLKQKYQNKAFIVVPHKPDYIKSKTHQYITVKLEVRSPCLACKKLGYATVIFEFLKDGHYLGARLSSFKKVSARTKT